MVICLQFQPKTLYEHLITSLFNNHYIEMIYSFQLSNRIVLPSHTQSLALISVKNEPNWRILHNSPIVNGIIVDVIGHIIILKGENWSIESFCFRRRPQCSSTNWGKSSKCIRHYRHYHHHNDYDWQGNFLNWDCRNYSQLQIWNM